MRVLGSRRVRLPYLVVYTDGLCRKILEGKRIRLIYLVFRMKTAKTAKVLKGTIFLICF